ncbi:MAG: cation:proton antiporter [Planctomycetota bacterium]
MLHLETIAVLFAAVAVFHCINERFLRLPSSVGLLLVSLVVLLLADKLGKHVGLGISSFVDVLEDAHPRKSLTMGILCLLVFATTMQVSIRDLQQQKWIVLGMSAIGVVVTTAVIGFLLPSALKLVDMRLSRFNCLLLGAMISPIYLSMAVEALQSRASKLTALVGREALFSVALGVVLFIVIAKSKLGGGGTIEKAGSLFFREVFRGALVGIPIGAVGYFVLSATSKAGTGMLVTLAVVFGGFALAGKYHASVPIVTLFAGLVVGLNANARSQLGPIWCTVEELLSAMLFVLIGAQFVNARSSLLLATAVAIGVVLLGRAAAVAVSTQVFGLHRRVGMTSLEVTKFLTWGGIRGGLSLALAMAYPYSGHGKVLVMVYGIVAFSIIVQGLTVKRI